MNREIKNAYWADVEKTQVICEFHYEDGTVLEATVMDTTEGNPDWAEIMEVVGSDVVDSNTEQRLADRDAQITQQEENQKDRVEKHKTEVLFAAKLEAFEIDEIKNSKDRITKSKIRKAKSIIEVQAYTTILLMKELENASEE